MSYGLRVWDASGRLRVDISTRLNMLVGMVTIPAHVHQNHTERFLAFPGMLNNGFWQVTRLYTPVPFIRGMTTRIVSGGFYARYSDYNGPAVHEYAVTFGVWRG